MRCQALKNGLMIIGKKLKSNDKNKNYYISFYSLKNFK